MFLDFCIRDPQNATFLTTKPLHLALRQFTSVWYATFSLTGVVKAGSSIRAIRTWRGLHFGDFSGLDNRPTLLRSWKVLPVVLRLSVFMFEHGTRCIKDVGHYWTSLLGS